jgi:uncharacterized iron-regulated membrane protein
MGVTVFSDPTEIVEVAFGRDGSCYANPYTGEVHAPGAARWRAFFLTMENWHRFLGRSGGQRAVGKAVNDVGNAAFLFLVLTGLILWWPRKRKTKGLKRSLWFLRGTTGRARDWNWHNVIGFWSAPILIILTGTAVVMSYRWANDLVYRVTSSPVPAQREPESPVILPPQPETQPLSFDALLATAQGQYPAWESVTLRLGNAPRPLADGRPGLPPAVVWVKERNSWPLFARTMLTFNPFTGEVLSRDAFADGSPGRRLRSWIRFLHTGEAFSLTGKFFAAVASLGACFLVYTGFAMSYRRFFLKKEEKPADVPVGRA